MQLTKAPPGHWLTGHVEQFSAGSRLAFLTRCAREFGDIVPIRFLHRRIWVMSHPEAIEQVLVTHAKDFRKHFGVRFYEPVLGNGLVSSEGDFWLRQRRLAQPAFLRNRMAGYGQIMTELAAQTRDRWRAGQSVDIHAEIRALTGAIALRTLFDLKDAHEPAEFYEALGEIMYEVSQKFSHFIQWPKWIPTPSNVRIRRAKERVDQLVHRLIAMRRAAGEGPDLLSVLLRARDEDDGRGMTDEQLRDEVLTLYLAGHETTALTLSWTWWLLSENPEVEGELAAEWRGVLGGRLPTPDDLPRLKYTDAVITEAMRIFPPVYLLGREALRTREVAGVRVRRGDTVFMSQWVVHRDPRWFESPLEFRPWRWLDGLRERIPKYAYFPFGGGPRVCIGNTFAQMEAVLILATLGQSFRFTVRSGLQPTPWPGLTLQMFGGLPAELRNR